jgi:hypothetical protein
MLAHAEQMREAQQLTDEQVGQLMRKTRSRTEAARTQAAAAAAAAVAAAAVR